MKAAANQFSMVFLGLGCLFSVAMWLISLHPNMRNHQVSLTPTLHLALSDGAMISFNTNQPYRGSILAAGSGANGSPPIKTTGLTLPGIYYRHIQLPGMTLWTYSISLLYPSFVFAFLSCIQWLRLRRAKSADALYHFRP